MRRIHAWKRAQSMTEMIILVVLVVIALAWLTTVLPDAIKAHFAHNQQILASPL